MTHLVNNSNVSFQTVYRQCKAEHNATVPNATYACQEPWGMVSEDVFPNLWRVIYWTSQFLTWLIMPLMQSYLKAGDFNIKGKLRSALIDNAIYYGTYLFICGFLLIYIALKPGVTLDWPKLKAIASSASNTWGLFLLVLLLGYGESAFDDIHFNPLPNLSHFSVGGSAEKLVQQLQTRLHTSARLLQALEIEFRQGRSRRDGRRCA